MGICFFAVEILKIFAVLALLNQTWVCSPECSEANTDTRLWWRKTQHLLQDSICDNLFFYIILSLPSPLYIRNVVLQLEFILFTVPPLTAVLAQMRLL